MTACRQCGGRGHHLIDANISDLDHWPIVELERTRCERCTGTGKEPSKPGALQNLLTYAILAVALLGLALPVFVAFGD